MPMNPIVETWIVSRVEPELPAEDVDRAGEAGESAGDRHRQEVVARDADAAVPGGLGVEADGAHLVAERRPVEDEPVDDERPDRDEETDVEALKQRVAPEHRKLRRLDDVVRDGTCSPSDAPCLERAAEPEEVRARPSRRSS